MLPTNTDPQPDSSGQPAIVLSFQNASFSFENPRSREGLDEANSSDVTDFKLNEVNLIVKQVLAMTAELSIFRLAIHMVCLKYFKGRAGMSGRSPGRRKDFVAIRIAGQTSTRQRHDIRSGT